VLPRHSAPGQYLRNLDLRNAHAGQYFISTTHEQDQAAYYYPLQIKLQLAIVNERIALLSPT
jgi:hypothetical protein